MSDVGQGTNGSNDDDMNDLFRSFLVDAEDLLAGTGGPAGSSHHSGGSGGNHSGASQSGGASVEHSAPAGFCLRVSDGGSAARGGGVGVRDAEGLAAVSRRTNASPQMDDMGGGGSGGSSQVCVVRGGLTLCLSCGARGIMFCFMKCVVVLYVR